MLKVSRRTSTSELKQSLLGVLCKRTNVGSWKHEVGSISSRQRPSVAVGIHTTTTTVHGAGNHNNNNRMKSSSNDNMVRLVGLTSIAAVGVLGGMYSYTKTNSAKPSSGTKSLIDNQKADWEAFHFQSLQYNEEDNEDEEENNYMTHVDDDADEDAAFTEDATVMVNNYVEEENDDGEEDEPTTCSICLINRQGPCRYPWKKFERCIKQQVPSSSSDSKDDKKVCDPFFLPWLECFSQHRLTYSILTNQSIRPEMDFLEETHGTRTPFPSELVPTLPSQQTNNSIATTIHDDKDDPKNNFSDQEQEIDEEEESLFDAMTSTVYQRKLLNIPLIDPTTGNTIYVAYVRDEPKGNILGFDYFTTELEQLQVQQQQQQQHTKEHLTKPIDEAHEQDDKEEDTTITQQTLTIPSTTTTGELMFHVPVGTTSVVIHALYKIKMNGEEEPKQDENRTNKKQHEKAMQPTENGIIMSEKVYVQTITLENQNGTY